MSKVEGSDLYRPYDSEKIPPCATVIIFYNSATNEFLLQKRSPSNPVLGGQTVFPSEKGTNDFLGTARRGVKEEMGDDIEIEEYKLLSKFSHPVGDWGKGLVCPVIVTKWKGQIKDNDLKNGTFIWINREKVMASLTNDSSKLIFLTVLTNLNLIRVKDFEEAPKIEIPS